MATDPAASPAAAKAPIQAPLGGSRSQAVQRLQVGLFGLAAMILLVGLASVIMNNARRNQAEVVRQQSPAATSSNADTTNSDPLADAGVVPDMPAAEKPPAPAGGGTTGH
jgi:hypothetical protein